MSHALYEMVGGFAENGAVQDQIDATIENAVKQKRGQSPPRREGRCKMSQLA
jgi:hypothetical protein